MADTIPSDLPGFTFDESTGQVFKEWTVDGRAVSVRGADDNWSRRRPYTLVRLRGRRGPRPLVHMALDAVADNMGEVDDECLETIPVHLLWRIWRRLEKRGLSLHAWKLFSKKLLREDGYRTLGLYRFRQHLPRPTAELRRYTEPVTSLSTDFITHIIITGGCGFSVNQMLCLADVKNLGVLELIQPADQRRAAFPDVSDGLIRGWSEMENPFPLLRVLRIWGDQGSIVTEESLRWVSKFPSLVLYDVLSLGAHWPRPFSLAADGGWELAYLLPDLDDSLSYYFFEFAVPNEFHHNNFRDAVRLVDSKLLRVCNRHRLPVKFVPDGEAPSLLDCFRDMDKTNDLPGKRDAAVGKATSCLGTAFEAWAFWLYAFLGHLNKDSDVKGRGIPSDQQAVAGSFVLPYKPFASLLLGDCGRSGMSVRPCYASGGDLHATQRFTFTRPGVCGGQTAGSSTEGAPGRQTETGPEPARRSAPGAQDSERAGPPLRRHKRRRLENMLQSLSGS